MRNKLVLTGSILALVLLLSACGPAISPTQARTLSVSGTGTVYLTPDIAYLYVGVHIEDADIAAAVQQNNAKTQALIDTLTSLGVAAKDIQTSNFSIWSTQDYNNTGEAITKYVVDNTVYNPKHHLQRIFTLAVLWHGRRWCSSASCIRADPAGSTGSLGHC